MQSLGFATDNGAFYSYHTEPARNYADTLDDVAAYAKRTGIPYRYVLLDSWWCVRRRGGGWGQYQSIRQTGEAANLATRPEDPRLSRPPKLSTAAPQEHT